MSGSTVLPMRATRRRIVELMRRGPVTVGEVARQLDLTSSGVRVHMTALERQGFVQRTGKATTPPNRPAAIYELAPAADALLSGAYIPFTVDLLRELGVQLPPARVVSVMSEVGRRLAEGYGQPSGTLRQRTEAASLLLNQLGALTEVEEAEDGFILWGHDCLLASAVQGSETVCRAMESFLSELVQAPVCESCMRDGRPSCRFRIVAPKDAGTTMRESTPTDSLSD